MPFPPRHPRSHFRNSLLSKKTHKFPSLIFDFIIKIPDSCTWKNFIPFPLFPPRIPFAPPPPHPNPSPPQKIPNSNPPLPDPLIRAHSGTIAAIQAVDSGGQGLGLAVFGSDIAQWVQEGFVDEDYGSGAREAQEVLQFGAEVRLRWAGGLGCGLGKGNGGRGKGEDLRLRCRLGRWVVRN